MYVPQGFAHGYQALTDGAAVFYLVSAFYAPQSEGGLRFDDPALVDRVAASRHRSLAQGCRMAAARPLILVTGGSGFVGRQVMRALIEQGCRLRVVVRPGRQSAIASSDSIEEIATSDLWSETPEGYAALCRDIDTVIHVAWYAEPGKYLQSPVNIDCLSGTLRLAQAAVDGQGAPLHRRRHLLRIRLRAGLSARRHAAQAVDALCRGQGGRLSRAVAISAQPGRGICLVPAVLSLRRRRGRAPPGAATARAPVGRRAGRSHRAASRSATISTCARPAA